MTKLLTFHSSVLSYYIAHLFYIAQELKKKKVARYRPVIMVAISNMAQRHVSFCERHIALHIAMLFFMCAMLPFMCAMLPFMCAMLPF